MKLSEIIRALGQMHVGTGWDVAVGEKFIEVADRLEQVGLSL